MNALLTSPLPGSIDDLTSPGSRPFGSNEVPVRNGFVEHLACIPISCLSTASGLFQRGERGPWSSGCAVVMTVVGVITEDHVPSLAWSRCTSVSQMLSAIIRGTGLSLALVDSAQVDCHPDRHERWRRQRRWWMALPSPRVSPEMPDAQTVQRESSGAPDARRCTFFASPHTLEFGAVHEALEAFMFCAGCFPPRV